MESTATTHDGGLAPYLGDLVLRVNGGPTHGETVRLGGRKSTIGSDATCTYRICDDQIQSVQCLILRGNGGTLVRRWADGTLLNGRQFSDSHLQIGDRLMIGHVEMEVIEDDALPSSSVDFLPHQEVSLSPEGDAQQWDRLQSMEETWQETCDGLRQEIACLQEERQTWQDQRSHWDSEMAGYQNAVEDLARQFDEFRQVRQQEHDWESEMAGYRDALADLTGQFDEFQQARQQEHDWESERAGYQDALADLARQLDEFQQVRQQEHDWESERAGYQDAVADLARQFDEFQQVRQREHDWESERVGYQDALADLARQFDEFQQVRQQEHDAWLDELQQLQALVELAASAKHEPPAEDAVPSSEETAEPSDRGGERFPQDEAPDARLERFIYDNVDNVESEEESGQENEPQWLDERESVLQQTGFLSDTFGVDDGSRDDSANVMPVGDQHASDASYVMEDCDQFDVPDTNEESDATQPPSWLDQYQGQQDESDSSISDYMNRLLQRVGGNDETPPYGDESGVEVNASTTEDAPSSEIVAPASDTETALVGPAALLQPQPSTFPVEDGEEEFVPRNAAPERNSNLAAMRELANASARNAIHTCDKKRTARSAMGRIPLLLVELGCGGALLYWALHTGQAVAYAGTAVCFIAAAMTGVRTLWLFSRTALAGLRMPKFHETADPSHAEEPS